MVNNAFLQTAINATQILQPFVLVPFFSLYCATSQGVCFKRKQGIRDFPGWGKIGSVFGWLSEYGMGGFSSSTRFSPPTTKVLLPHHKVFLSFIIGTPLINLCSNPFYFWLGWTTIYYSLYINDKFKFRFPFQVSRPNIQTTQYQLRDCLSCQGVSIRS